MEENIPLKPNNNLVFAIFTTICCCLPFGIVAIIKASKVDGLYMSKQYDMAVAQAADAKKWCFIALGVGLVFQIIYIALYGAAAIAGLQ